MKLDVPTVDDDADAHQRTAAGALAFVGALGLVHAAVFTWLNLPSYIEPPALLVISASLLGVAAWMCSTTPSDSRR